MRLLLIHNLPPWDPRAGGGQRVQHELAVAAVGEGHDVRVMYVGDGRDAPTTPYAVEWVAERQRGPGRLLINTVAIARGVQALLGRWRPDVVHGSAAEAGLLPIVLPPGVGLTATSHHPDPPPLPHTLAGPRSSFATVRRLQAAYLEAHLLRRAHRVVAVSRWGAEVLGERGYLPPVRPIAVVPNGVAAAWFVEETPPIQDAAPSFLVVGRLEPAKGWDVLLDAIARPEAPAGARVLLAGRGPDERAVLERAAALGISDRVRTLGWLDPDALRAELARATALVLPSRRENYPLVLLEAMAARVPALATRVGGVPEMIADGESGLLVAPEDARALALALARLAADPALRARLISGGRAVAERHRWDRIVVRLAHEYHLARELARPVPRAPTSPASTLLRKATARAAAARAPRARPRAAPADPRRIAVVRPGRLGDLLLTGPLLAALAQRWPRASIELITDASDRPPPWLLGGAVEQRTLALRRGPDAWQRPGAPERRASVLALAAAWSAAPPDLLLFAVDATDPVLGALAAELAAAAPHAWRAGLVSGSRPVPALHAAVDPGPPATHEIDRLLRLAAAVGADATFRLPRLPEGESPLPRWEGPTVVFHPGASRENRRWPLARWGELAMQLAAAGGRTVVVGDKGDRMRVRELAIAFDEHGFLDRVGALDLSSLTTVIARADAFVGNDSFPFHVAAAAGIPTLVLVGPGAAKWTSYPAAHVGVIREPVLCSPRYGEECPVYTTCPHGACMQSIRVETVADALLARLRGSTHTGKS